MELWQRNLSQMWIAARVARDLRISVPEAMKIVALVFAHLFPHEEN